MSSNDEYLAGLEQQISAAHKRLDTAKAAHTAKPCFESSVPVATASDSLLHLLRRRESILDMKAAVLAALHEFEVSKTGAST